MSREKCKDVPPRIYLTSIKVSYIKMLKKPPFFALLSYHGGKEGICPEPAEG
jgi:hypothetical protein